MGRCPSRCDRWQGCAISVVWRGTETPIINYLDAPPLPVPLVKGVSILPNATAHLQPSTTGPVRSKSIPGPVCARSRARRPDRHSPRGDPLADKRWQVRCGGARREDMAQSICQSRFTIIHGLTLLTLTRQYRRWGLGSALAIYLTVSETEVLRCRLPPVPVRVSV